jgi:hypothetical protein
MAALMMTNAQYSHGSGGPRYRGGAAAGSGAMRWDAERACIIIVAV